jgi:Ca2+-binding EF-hand superfamily protein
MAEKAMAGMDSQIDSRFKAMDKNGDGKITREEVPRAQQRFFELLDGNHDGVLDKDEVKKMIGASAGAAGGIPGGLPGGGGRKNGGG